MVEWLGMHPGMAAVLVRDQGLSGLWSLDVCWVDYCSSASLSFRCWASVIVLRARAVHTGCVCGAREAPQWETEVPSVIHQHSHGVCDHSFQKREIIAEKLRQFPSHFYFTSYRRAAATICPAQYAADVRQHHRLMPLGCGIMSGHITDTRTSQLKFTLSW